MELKGSKTEANLWAAFAGESQARNKYTFYAEQARKEGYEQIGGIFEETANNEKEHAKLWFQQLSGIGGTADNLLHGAMGEKYEWSDMYKKFEEDARQEGFERIANLFKGVADIERSHEERYNALKAPLETGQVFQRPEQQVWICRNCGHIHVGAEAPTVCPVCAKPQAYFELQPKNY